MDLSHHINAKSKARHPSPLKDIIRYMGQEGMVSLAGGLPHPSLFPLHRATIAASNPSSSDEIELQLSNDTAEPKLAEFLQYGTGAGNEHLRKWCLDFTHSVHKPALKDVDVLLHPGNTNAWAKVVDLLCEKGEYILCESFTYPSSQAYWIPLGNYAAPIGMDGEGIRDDLLREKLSNWETEHPGIQRPHVLYLVSVGSNPTGVTMGAERRKKVYDVCVEFDIIIVEDDPYYFIQYPTYNLGEANTATTMTNNEYLSSLAPSFLKYDYQGRVFRLESFSKTLAPGLRLGYFIANPMFIERLLRATEVETQDPSGLSQAVVLSLLQNWSFDGYITWLQNIRLEYEKRRNWMIDAFSREFTLVPALAKSELGESSEGIVAMLNEKEVFSFVPPSGGMFIWATFYLSGNPTFVKLQEDPDIEDPEQTLADDLWRKLADKGVLLVPGSYYFPWQGKEKASTKARGETGKTYFRFSFAMTTKEEIELGIARLAEVLRSSWGL